MKKPTKARDVTFTQRQKNLKALRAKVDAEKVNARREAAKAVARGKAEAAKGAAFEAIAGMAYDLDAAHYQRAAIAKAQAAFREAIVNIAVQACVAVMKSTPVPAPVLQYEDLRAAVLRILSELPQPTGHHELQTVKRDARGNILGTDSVREYRYD